LLAAFAALGSHQTCPYNYCLLKIELIAVANLRFKPPNALAEKSPARLKIRHCVTSSNSE
jgi:hypothetical protein